MAILPSTFLRPDLGLVVSEQMLNDSRFIATTIFPEFSCAAISDTFTRVAAKATSQSVDTRYAGGRPKRVNFAVEQDSYECQPQSVEQAIRDLDKGRAKGRINIEAMAAAVPALILMTSLEREAEGVLNNNTNLPLSGNNGATPTAWSNAAAATPILDVLNGHTGIRNKTGGMRPDTMVLPWAAWVNLSQTDQILNRIRNVDIGVRKGILENTLLNDLFQVERILIPGAFRDTANQGVPATLADVWDPRFVYLLVTAPKGRAPDGSPIQADLQGVAQIGRTMFYADESWGGGTFGIQNIRDDIECEDLYRAFGNWQVKFFGQAFGYRMQVAP